MSLDNRRGPNSPNPPQQQKRPSGGMRFSVLWVVLLGVAILGNVIVSSVMNSSTGNNPSITYSQFKTEVAQNQVASVVTQADVVTGVFKSSIDVPTTDGKSALTKSFTTR